MKKINILIIVISLLITILLISCIKIKDKDSGNFTVEGKVINVGSNEPVDSVLVILYGGNPLSNPFMPDFNDNPPSGNDDSTYTDKNGYFKVSIRNESMAYIGYRCSNTRYRHCKYLGDINGEFTERTNLFSSPGSYDISILVEADCDFYPIFEKLNNKSPNDTLKVFLNSNYWEVPREFNSFPHATFTGLSPFDLSENRLWYCTGDTYIVYKLEYTDNGEWQTKLDSILVKSFETYKDTIYY